MKPPCRRWRLAVLCIALSPAAPAQSVDPSHSELVFVTRMMGVPVQGRFTRWDATLQFDPRHAQAGRVALRIDIASATFVASEVSAEARRAVWFDAAQFPQAAFDSASIKPLGGGRFEMSGRLTLKGRERDLVIPVNLAQTGSTGRASGSFTLQRLDFGIGTGEWADASLVEHEVQVRFQIALTGLGAP